MKKLFFLYLFVNVLFSSLFAQTKDPKDTEVWTPVPRVVTPGNENSAPSDAIILFDGTSTEHFVSYDGKPIQWKIKDGVLVPEKGLGDILTVQKFGDIQLHLEWRTPEIIDGEGQGRGNSGVFFQNRYEVQILDSYENKTYPNGQAAAVYKQHIPLVNACRPPGVWQTYDIIFRAPRFNKDGIKVASGTLTVLQNGVLVQNNVEIKGTSEYIGLPRNEAHGPAPLKLQEHSNTTSFRNIWIREL